MSASRLRHRIVVVDADDAIRELVGEWLTDAGYRVLAQAVPAAPVGEVHLVVLDLVHLRSFGEQAVAGARRLFAGVPILGLSTQLGASLPAHAQAAARLGLDVLLAKPCGRDELLACVRTLLDST